MLKEHEGLVGAYKSDNIITLLKIFFFTYLDYNPLCLEKKTIFLHAISPNQPVLEFGTTLTPIAPWNLF